MPTEAMFSLFHPIFQPLFQLSFVQFDFHSIFVCSIFMLKKTSAVFDTIIFIFQHRQFSSFSAFTEHGGFLALDLGGTNFRVILMELDEGKITNEIVKMYEIGSELRVGGEEVAIALFDHIGQCLCDFLEENDLVSVPLPLGE